MFCSKVAWWIFEGFKINFSLKIKPDLRPFHEAMEYNGSEASSLVDAELNNSYSVQKLELTDNETSLFNACATYDKNDELDNANF